MDILNNLCKSNVVVIFNQESYLSSTTTIKLLKCRSIQMKQSEKK